MRRIATTLSSFCFLASCVGEDSGVTVQGGPDASAVANPTPLDASSIVDAASDVTDVDAATASDGGPPTLVDCQDAGIWGFSTPGWSTAGTACTEGDGGFTNCAVLSASDGGSAVRARSNVNAPVLGGPLNQVARLRFSIQVNASNGTYRADIALARRSDFAAFKLQLDSTGTSRTLLLTSVGATSPLGPVDLLSTPVELTLAADSTWARLGSAPYVRMATTADPNNPRFELGPLILNGTNINLGVSYSPIATELCAIP
jgi:hypothetical protein